MAVSKIKPEDINILYILLQLKGEVFVYDPLYRIESAPFPIFRDIATFFKSSVSQSVCINLSGQPLEFLSFDFILEFDQPNRKYKSFFCEHFLTVNNIDGSIRWFLPESSKHPLFLDLYNGSGLKASLFRYISKMMFKLGLKKLICSGSFSLYSKTEHHFYNIYAETEMAVFTGTLGENRKAIAACGKNGIADYFIKIPISEKASQLIESEYNNLSLIHQINLKKVITPKGEKQKMGLRLSNIKPKEPLSSISISKIHLQALKELYAKTVQIKTLSGINFHENIQDRLVRIKRAKDIVENKIPLLKQERLAYNIKVLLNSIDENELTSVAVAHGDFTPWNMFVTEERIHLYDWELAMREQILLYDVFHFIFQTSVLILHQSFDQIKKKINRLKGDAIMQDIVERYNIDYQTCYKCYLINNCSYYLDLYTRQGQIHEQAFWLIDTWIAATGDAIKTNQLHSIMVS